jgi:hypothetical protein
MCCLSIGCYTQVLVTQLLRLLTHLLLGVWAMMAFSLKLPKLGSINQMVRVGGIVTVVMATQTLLWDGITLLSLVGARIKTFTLVSNLMERIVTQVNLIGTTFTNNHIHLRIQSSFNHLPTLLWREHNARTLSRLN